VRVAPPTNLMSMLHAIADESRFPVIKGLSMTPTLTCERPGYDPGSQLFLAFPEGMFPPAPMQPTRGQAEAALARLARPLRGFPFPDAAARSVALSGMLSSVVRGELRTCPLHIIDAPAAGIGKTKLAEIIGIMGTGVPPSGVTHSADGEENEKRLVSILRPGDPVVLIDNVSADLEGDFLCAMLTNEAVQARILGQSERVRMGTRVLMLATGNNVRLRGDMTRRAVACRLDAKMANPDERVFDFDAVQEVRDARPGLVADALTVVRAYIAAGRPASLDAFGSFDDRDLVRGALVWLGHADPAETRVAVRVSDDADLRTALPPQPPRGAGSPPREGARAGRAGHPGRLRPAQACAGVDEQGRSGRLPLQAGQDGRTRGPPGTLPEETLMLTRAEYKEMTLDRFFWLLEQVGEAAHLALNDCMSEKASRPPAMMEIARRHSVDVNVVLAAWGWLPLQREGGPPFVHVDNPYAFGHDVYLVSYRHRAAYVFYADMAQAIEGDAWSPYPAVESLYPFLGHSIERRASHHPGRRPNGRSDQGQGRRHACRPRRSGCLTAGSRHGAALEPDRVRSADQPCRPRRPACRSGRREAARQPAACLHAPRALPDAPLPPVQPALREPAAASSDVRPVPGAGRLSVRALRGCSERCCLSATVGEDGGGAGRSAPAGEKERDR
jgi:hypothetical protein